MSTLDLAGLRAALEADADPADAEPMARYMKNRFAFLGIKTPARRAASRPTFAAAKSADVDDVLEFVAACWDQPEREFQYVGSDVLARVAARLRASDLGAVEQLIRTKSWWDTVDSLASPTVGTMVRTHPGLVSAMDDWIGSDDIWIARTAIIHQLRFGADTDEERLFRYCTRRAADTEFFIRKAIGWALRQHARTAPDAVRAFVAVHEHELSGLSRREALRNLDEPLTSEP